MDNASKNAGDMIASLQLKYNRGRQAAITNELVDIITGAFLTVFLRSRVFFCVRGEANAWCDLCFPFTGASAL